MVLVANPGIIEVGSNTFVVTIDKGKIIAPMRKQEGREKTHPENREAELRMYGIRRDLDGPSRSPRRPHDWIVGSEPSTSSTSIAI